MKKRTVMIRMLVETNASNETLTAALVGAVRPHLTGRVWSAVDHPTPEGAEMFWARVERDPGGTGPATGKA